MGRPPDRINKLAFPEVWREIETYHEKHWEIRLRPAANLIGYFLFPVGWHWTEFRPLKEKDKIPYEQVARETSRQGLPLKRPIRQPALKRWQAGCRFRQNAAKEYLEKLLVRDGLKHFCHSVRNPALHNRDTRPVRRSLNRSDFSKMHVVGSTVGRLTSEQFDLTVDAKGLVSLLVAATETRGAPSKHNLLEVERWCRNHLELNTGLLKETSNLRATLINRAWDWQGETYPEPAGPDQIRPIVDRLLTEYDCEE